MGEEREVEIYRAREEYSITNPFNLRIISDSRTPVT